MVGHAWAIVIIFLSFLSIAYGYTILVGFEDRLLYTEDNKRLQEGKNIPVKKSPVKPAWYIKDTVRYKRLFGCFCLIGVITIAGLFFTSFESPDNEKGKIVNNYFIKSNFGADTTHPKNMFTDTISIGPFVRGWDTLKLSDAKIGIEKLRMEFKNKKLSNIYIFGGVDVASPVRDSRKKFGDNLTLAIARANKIRTYILDSVYQNDIKPDILIFPFGANSLLTSYSDSDHTKNRVVYLYGKY